MGEKRVDLWRIGVLKSWFEWSWVLGSKMGPLSLPSPRNTGRFVALHRYTDKDLNDAGTLSFTTSLRTRERMQMAWG